MVWVSVAMVWMYVVIVWVHVWGLGLLKLGCALIRCSHARSRADRWVFFCMWLLQPLLAFGTFAFSSRHFFRCQNMALKNSLPCVTYSWDQYDWNCVYFLSLRAHMRHCKPVSKRTCNHCVCTSDCMVCWVGWVARGRLVAHRVHVYADEYSKTSSAFIQSS